MLFVGLLYLRQRLKPAPQAKPRLSGYVMRAYLAGYAVIRFVIEYMRGDPRAAVGPLSISQTISVVMMTLGVGVIWYNLFRERRQTCAGS